MKRFFGLALSLLSLTPTAKAEPIVLFEAKEQCNAHETAKGIRYIPPCNLTETELTFTIPENQETPTDKQNLSLNFHCEALRPLSIEYQISRQEKIIISGKLAPTDKNDSSRASFSMLQPADDYRLKLNKLNGMKGFQAIKPDCRLILEIGEKHDEELASLPGY